MTDAPLGDWDGIDTRKRERSWSRQVGCGLLASAALLSLRYWVFLGDDVELIKAYSAAYSSAMTILLASGVAPFITHRIKQK